jgi:hypothetical protein
MKKSSPGSIGLLFVVLLLAGCKSIVPATTPPQLEWTAGPSIIITDKVLETAEFTLNYPSDWRVVTGEAQLPPTVTLVSPDEKSTITLNMGELPAGNYGDDDGTMTVVRGISLKNGKSVTAVGKAPADRWESFLTVFEAVVASIH